MQTNIKGVEGYLLMAFFHGLAKAPTRRRNWAKRVVRTAIKGIIRRENRITETQDDYLKSLRMNAGELPPHPAADVVIDSRTGETWEGYAAQVEAKKRLKQYERKWGPTSARLRQARSMPILRQLRYFTATGA